MEEKDWNVDVFRCAEVYDKKYARTSSLEKILAPPPITNGERFLLCFEPNTAAREENIYIAMIESFQFSEVENTNGERISQTVVSAFGEGIYDDKNAVVTCHPGSDMCVIDMSLSNEFFHTSGRIKGEGIVRLQFGYSPKRKIRRSLLRVGTGEDVTTTATSSSSEQVYLDDTMHQSHQQQQQQQQRSMVYQVGEFVGERLVEEYVRIEPSTDRSYEAELFQCDNGNKRLERPESIQKGQALKLCIVPNEEAMKAGVSIRSIDSFSYGFVNKIDLEQYGADVASYQEQHADSLSVAIYIEGHASTMGNTRFDCSNTGHGASLSAQICTMETLLEDSYFIDEKMVMTGYVNLQFGDGAQRQLVDVDATTTATTTTRNLQHQQEYSTGLGFAGRSQVSYYFSTNTNGGFVSPSSDGGSGNLPSWLIATVVIVFGLLILCGMVGYFFFYRHKRKEEITLPLPPRSSLSRRQSLSSNTATKNRNSSMMVSSESIRINNNSSSFLHSTKRMDTSRRSSSSNKMNRNNSMVLSSINDNKSSSFLHPTGRRMSMRRSAMEDDEIAIRTFNNSKSLIRRSSSDDNNDDNDDEYEESVRINNNSSSFLHPTERRDTSHHSSSSNKMNRNNSMVLSSINDNKSSSFLHPTGRRTSTSTRRSAMEDYEIATRTFNNSKSLIRRSGSDDNNDDNDDEYDKSKNKRTSTSKKQQRRRESIGSLRTSKSKKKEKRTKSLDFTISEMDLFSVPSEADDKLSATGKTEETAVMSNEISIVIPNKEDVCFEAKDHKGTEAFLEAVQNTVTELGDSDVSSDYSPKVYKHIKRQLPGRQFYVAVVCDDDDDDDDNDDDFSSWRSVTKRELIHLFSVYYEQAKLQQQQQQE